MIGDSLIDNPIYYRVEESIILSTYDLRLPRTLGLEIGCLLLREGDLEDPEIEPIAIFYRSGIRNYLWRTKIWCDVDLSRTILNHLKYIKCEETKQRLRYLINNSWLPHNTAPDKNQATFNMHFRIVKIK